SFESRTTCASSVGAMFQVGSGLGSGFTVPNSLARASAGRKLAYRPHIERIWGRQTELSRSNRYDLQVIGPERRIAGVGAEDETIMTSRRRVKGGNPADASGREDVGLRLEALRLQRGITQISLAEILKIRQ